MRMRIGEGMKLVAIVAVGFGIAQWVWRRSEPVFSISAVSRLANQIDFIRVRGVPMAAGLAIAIAGVAWAERASRRSRNPWGVGRWFASAVALYLLLNFLRQLGLYLQLGLFRRWEQLDNWRADVADWIKDGLSDDMNSHSSFGIVACWLSARLAGWRGDPKPDIVEWSGRLVFLATCVITIGLTFVLDSLY